VFPGGDELCGGGDEDCSGAVDDGAVDAVLLYDDADLDGFGDPSTGALRCPAPGLVTDDNDCDDGDDTVLDGFTFYRDADGDAFRQPVDHAVPLRADDRVRARER
jgi:hypothetical protein